MVFPISAESYFGSDADLKARLAEFPDNWKLVAHEAANQTMRVNGQEMPYPALLKAADIAGQLLKIESDGTLGTLTVTGLSDAGASWQMVEWGDGGTVPLGKRFDFEANPQVNYDVDSGDWTAVFSIQFNDTCRSRQFKFTRSE